MRFKLFTQVALARDVPEKALQAGDVAMIVEHHPAISGEDGYTLEVFDAVGETLAVLTVAESEIEELRAGEVLSVRALATT
jgi:hypothetical protein